MSREVWARVLVADEDTEVLSECERALRGQGYSIDLALGLCEAEVLLASQSYDLVLIDATLLDADYVPLWQLARESVSSRPCLAILHRDDPIEAIDLLRVGADDVVEIPAPAELLRLKVRNAMQRAREQRARIRLLRGYEDFRESGGPVGFAPTFRRCLESVLELATEDEPVLFVGEAGVGKALLARHLHQAAGFHGTLHFGEAPELDGARLLEFESHCGVPGTLALRYLERMPEDGQLMLAERVPILQRTGVRVLATASLPDEAEAPPDPLVPELRHVLRTRVRVPPLRERSEDIALLATTFLGRLTVLDRHHGFDPEVLPLLTAMRWTGNVAQLRFVVEAALRDARRPRIGLAEIEAACIRHGHGEELRTASARLRELLELPAAAPPVLPFEVEERRILVRALREAGGHVGRAAALLQIGRATLYRKIQHFEIGKEEMRVQLPRG